MTLQEHKEKEAQKHLNKSEWLNKSRTSFISGFDAADPIGFADWIDTSNWCRSIVTGKWYDCFGDTKLQITTEQLYMKFVEFKNAQK